jgi:carboxymethylenebutenolidase
MGERSISITRRVSFRSGSQDLEAYLTHPEGERPFPGVVVIHEVLGLNYNLKSIATSDAQ